MWHPYICDFTEVPWLTSLYSVSAISFFKQANGHNASTKPPQLLSAIVYFNVPEKYQQLLQKKEKRVFGIRDSLWSFPDAQPRSLEKKGKTFSSFSLLKELSLSWNNC